jgi:hypothetical protein
VCVVPSKMESLDDLEPEEDDDETFSGTSHHWMRGVRGRCAHVGPG